MEDDFILDTDRHPFMEEMLALEFKEQWHKKAEPSAQVDVIEPGQLIQSDEVLLKLSEKLQHVTEVAIISYDLVASYSPSCRFLVLSCNGETFVLDLSSKISVQSILGSAVLENPNILKVVYGDDTIKSLQRSFKIYPYPVFDAQVLF